MSQKFEKNRSVDFRYLAVPMCYTGIKHRHDAKKELVLIDFLHNHWIAAYRSDRTQRVGRTFKLPLGEKNGKPGFYHRGKLYTYSKGGWVW